MKGSRTITTRLPTPADLEPARVRRLADLINDVYGDAESGMWQAGATRTNPDEVARLLSDGALILAELDGVVVGSVHVSRLGDGVGELGMLVADRAYRGLGIGSALVEAAEQWALGHGCHTMRLEILTPRHWKHPSKEFLKAWYGRIGYRAQEPEPFENMYPDLVPALATECDFTVWLKPLRPG